MPWRFNLLWMANSWVVLPVLFSPVMTWTCMVLLLSFETGLGVAPEKKAQVPVRSPEHPERLLVGSGECPIYGVCDALAVGYA
ncbi:hypothetical protein EMIT0P2_100059 [Pseudomonas sp. IT-P2]